MLNNKKKLIMVAGALLFILIVFVGGYFLTVFNGRKIITPAGNKDNKILNDGQLPLGEGDSLIPDENKDIKTPNNQAQILNNNLSEEEKSKSIAVSRAKFFVEMIGSYSPEAMFQNVIDLKPYMTNKMKLWADDFITKNLPGIEENKESAITQVFKTETISETKDRMKIAIYARREKTIFGKVETINENALVEILFIDNDWYIDNLTWR